MARETDLMNLMNRIESLENRVRFLSRLESGAGILVAHDSASFTGTQTASVASGASVDITSLSISHAASSASNEIFLLGQVGILASSVGRANVGLAFTAGGTKIGAGDTASNRTLVSAGGYTEASSDTANSESRFIMAVYTPGSTASVTYKLTAINIRGTTETLYINRTENDADAAAIPRGSSWLKLFELAA